MICKEHSQRTHPYTRLEVCGHTVRERTAEDGWMEKEREGEGGREGRGREGGRVGGREEGKGD